jgi:hypothetical protein
VSGEVGSVVVKLYVDDTPMEFDAEMAVSHAADLAMAHLNKSGDLLLARESGEFLTTTAAIGAVCAPDERLKLVPQPA